MHRLVRMFQTALQQSTGALKFDPCAEQSTWQKVWPKSRKTARIQSHNLRAPDFGDFRSKTLSHTQQVLPPYYERQNEIKA